MDLYPTPTRVQLLHDVDAGRVFYSGPAMSSPAESTLRIPGERWRAVTKRCDEMERAGWIQRERFNGRSVAWQLTDKGRKILDGGP